MPNCDSCDRHVHDLFLKRIRCRIKGSGRAPFVHADLFCMRYKSSRVTWKIASGDALMELLRHASFLCAFCSNIVRPLRLCASLKSRRLHPSYCVDALFVRTQCSCSSGFSIVRRPWIRSSVKYYCSLVPSGDVRSRTNIFKRITTWKRSSSLSVFEGTVRILWFHAPFEKIDLQRGGVKPAPTDTEEMHTAEGQ